MKKEGKMSFIKYILQILFWPIVRKIKNFIKSVKKKRKQRAKEKRRVKLFNERIKQFTDMKLNTCERDEKILVSLTTHGLRMKTVHYTVMSILSQEMKPDRIVVYLDESDKENVTPELLQMKEEYGIEIEYVSEYIRAHTKYYHAMKDNSDYIVITVDDDLLYPVNMISDLYSGHIKYPNTVIASRAHRMIITDGKLQKYNDWIWECYEYEKPSNQLFATGAGGVLYPPHCIDTKVFDLEPLKNCAHNADDVWLKFAEMYSGIKVFAVPGIFNKVTDIPYTQGESLYSSNVEACENDMIIEKSMKFWGIKTEDILD